MADDIHYGDGDKLPRVRQVVHELLLDKWAAGEVPTNIRFLFYELEQRGDARKAADDDLRKNTRRSIGWPPGEQDVTDAVKWLRDEGIVPWEWIIDETRRVDVWTHAPTVAEYLRDRLREATVNPWGTEPPLILCESKATAGVLRSAVSEYVCPIAGTAGQTGGFLRTVIAPLLGDERRVLYLGDLDKSGKDIEGNSRRVLEHALGRELSWERVAITEAQAEGIEPIVKRDGRTKEVGECWEAETLGQGALVAIVRGSLDELLPEPLADVQEREAEQREAMTRLLNVGGE